MYVLAGANLTRAGGEGPDNDGVEHRRRGVAIRQTGESAEEMHTLANVRWVNREKGSPAGDRCRSERMHCAGLNSDIVFSSVS